MAIMIGAGVGACVSARLVTLGKTGGIPIPAAAAKAFIPYSVSAIDCTATVDESYVTDGEDLLSTIDEITFSTCIASF